MSRYYRRIGLFLVPYVFGSILLVLIPALVTAIIAFTEYHAASPPVWVGLENLNRLFSSSYVRISLRNSFIFLVLAVPLRLVASLLLALLLQTRRRFCGFFRTAIFIPTIIPEVAYALIWLWVFNPLYGPLNGVLKTVGLPQPGWLVEPGTARLAMVIISLFQIGEGFIVVLAGLQNIPRLLYDAARVDGASNWQLFWKITLPLLAPWLLLFTFRDLVLSLQNTFTPSYVLTYGGPYYATTFMPLLIYELAFDFFDLGLAAAVLLIFFLMIILMVWGMLGLIGLRGREGG